VKLYAQIVELEGGRLVVLTPDDQRSDARMVRLFNAARAVAECLWLAWADADPVTMPEFREIADSAKGLLGGIARFKEQAHARGLRKAGALQ